MIIKPLANMMIVTTANTVDNATCVFINNPSSSLVRTLNVDGVQSFLLRQQQSIVVIKLPTATIAANGAVECTKIGLR